MRKHVWTKKLSLFALIATVACFVVACSSSEEEAVEGAKPPAESAEQPASVAKDKGDNLDHFKERLENDGWNVRSAVDGTIERVHVTLRAKRDDMTADIELFRPANEAVGWSRHVGKVVPSLHGANRGLTRDALVSALEREGWTLEWSEEKRVESMISALVATSGQAEIEVHFSVPSVTSLADDFTARGGVTWFDENAALGVWIEGQRAIAQDLAYLLWNLRQQ